MRYTVVAMLLLATLGPSPSQAQTPDAGSGHLLYQAPQGWKAFSREEITFFVPAGLKRSENVVLTVLPDQRVEGEEGGATWFRGVVRQALSPLRVVHTDPIVGTRTRFGYDPIMTGAITEGKDGKRLYWFVAARCHRTRGVAISYSASSPALFRKYKAQVAAFLGSMTLVAVAPPPAPGR